MRKGAIFRLVVIGLAASAFALAMAWFPAWFPTEASVEAGRINFVFWFTTAICIGVFGLVAAVTLYSIWKFRVRPDDDTDGEPIHGNTKLEIWWTAIPAVLVTAIGVVSAVVLAQNARADNPLRVDVTAQQFAWIFEYTDQGGVTSTTLRLPLDRPVKLYLQAKDVIHSFWVPEFAQKQDAVPGITTELVITPNRLGRYPVICTELCGLGHASMRAEALVVPPAEFDAWVREQRAAVSGGGAEAGQAVYAENGCGSCHTFGPAGSKSTVGPDLDDLAAQAKRAGEPLEDFVRSSIVAPDDYVEPGFAPGIMPKTYGQLPKDQLDALVQYLAGAGK